MHENAREVAHGLIAPERLVVTPHARLVIVEHVMAAAVEQLQFGRDRLFLARQAKHQEHQAEQAEQSRACADQPNLVLLKQFARGEGRRRGHRNGDLFGIERRFERQRFHYQLIAPHAIESNDACYQVMNSFEFVGRGRFDDSAHLGTGAFVADVRV